MREILARKDIYRGDRHAQQSAEKYLKAKLVEAETTSARLTS